MLTAFNNPLPDIESNSKVLSKSDESLPSGDTNGLIWSIFVLQISDEQEFSLALIQLTFPLIVLISPL